ncbi:MAG: hypothetical protein IMW90_18195 [Thermogemmatispora sp.]|uniref:hypothetical protein n=1 Tax=Thermogemmatispora TaxID=768669 RepID=UPI0014788612|nr:hypothetical protein [Thermogemmatispora sp.]
MRPEIDPGSQGRCIKEVILHPPEQQGRRSGQRLVQFPGHGCATLRDRLAGRAWDLQRESEHASPIGGLPVGCPVGGAHRRRQSRMAHRAASQEEVTQHEMTPPIQVVSQGARATGQACQLEGGGLPLRCLPR